jgi:DNA-binding Lrp family transcriptional regulator
MIQAFVFIEAEPGRIQELVQELAGIQLDSSVIKQVYAVTGRYDLVALVESPNVTSLGD